MGCVMSSLGMVRMGSCVMEPGRPSMRPAGVARMRADDGGCVWLCVAARGTAGTGRDATVAHAGGSSKLRAPAPHAHQHHTPASNPPTPPTCALVDGGQIGVHVAGVAAAAGHLLARSRHLAQRIGVGRHVCMGRRVVGQWAAGSQHQAISCCLRAGLVAAMAQPRCDQRNRNAHASVVAAALHHTPVRMTNTCMPQS